VKSTLRSSPDLSRGSVGDRTDHVPTDGWKDPPSTNRKGKKGTDEFCQKAEKKKKKKRGRPAWLSMVTRPWGGKEKKPLLSRGQALGGKDHFCTFTWKGGMVLGRERWKGKKKPFRVLFWNKKYEDGGVSEGQEKYQKLTFKGPHTKKHHHYHEKTSAPWGRKI